MGVRKQSSALRASRAVYPVTGLAAFMIYNLFLERGLRSITTVRSVIDAGVEREMLH